MWQPRFAIKQLIVFITVIAIGLAAFSHPTVWWSLVVATLFITLLLTAILGSLLRRGSKRAFWIGFAVFGLAYLAPAWMSGESNNQSNMYHLLVINPAPGFLEIVAALAFGETPLAQIVTLLGAVEDKYALTVTFSLIGLIFAYLGGLIGRFLGRESGKLQPGTQPGEPVKPAQ